MSTLPCRRRLMPRWTLFSWEFCVFSRFTRVTGLYQGKTITRRWRDDGGAERSVFGLRQCSKGCKYIWNSVQHHHHRQNGEQAGKLIFSFPSFRNYPSRSLFARRRPAIAPRPLIHLNTFSFGRFYLYPSLTLSSCCFW